jgi:hypothetical protein
MLEESFRCIVKRYFLFEIKNSLISVSLLADDSFHHFLIVAKEKKKVVSHNDNFPPSNIKHWHIASYT